MDQRHRAGDAHRRSQDRQRHPPGAGFRVDDERRMDDMRRYCFQNESGSYVKYMSSLTCVYTSTKFDEVLWLEEPEFSVQEVVAFCSIINKISNEGRFSIKVQTMDIVDFEPNALVVKDKEWGMA